MSFLSGKDETELAELDRALGIDKLVQVPGKNGNSGIRECRGKNGGKT